MRTVLKMMWMYKASWVVVYQVGLCIVSWPADVLLL